MAHEIEGDRMMYVGSTPWHGLGKRLEAPPTVEEGIRAAGLDWRVGLEQLKTQDGTNVPAFATIRESDRKVLGVVGPQYHPLQNIDAFKWFQPWLDVGAATLHTAGSLRGGTRIWVLAHVGGGTEVVPGDRVDNYVLLSNSHDGTMAVRAGFTPIRVVCANTLAMAHGNRSASKLIRVRHTASMADNLKAIRDVMDLARREFIATAAQFRRLANQHVSQADVKRYVRQVLGAEDDDDSKDSTRFTNMVREVVMLGERGRGQNVPGVRGTLWGAYNGLTEWLGWERGKNADRRLDSLWFGSAATMNDKALEIALQMAS